MKVNKDTIIRLKAHDEQAFNLIYEEYYKLIFSIIYNFVQDVELTKDLMMDSFQTAYLKIDMLKSDEVTSFKYWLIQIAKNLSKDHLKSKKNKNLVYDEEAVMNEPASESLINVNEVMRLVYEKLTLEESEILNYYLIGGLKFREIALLLNSTTSIIAKKYHKAIKSLKNYL